MNTRIDTVNVVLINNATKSTEIQSFSETEEGNRDAEKAFREAIAKHASNGNEYTEEDFEACIENGYESFGAGMIMIVHSE